MISDVKELVRQKLTKDRSKDVKDFVKPRLIKSRLRNVKKINTLPITTKPRQLVSERNGLMISHINQESNTIKRINAICLKNEIILRSMAATISLENLIYLVTSLLLNCMMRIIRTKKGGGHEKWRDFIITVLI